MDYLTLEIPTETRLYVEELRGGWYRVTLVPPLRTGEPKIIFHAIDSEALDFIKMALKGTLAFDIPYIRRHSFQGDIEVVPVLKTE